MSRSLCARRRVAPRDGSRRLATARVVNAAARVALATVGIRHRYSLLLRPCDRSILGLPERRAMGVNAHVIRNQKSTLIVPPGARHWGGLKVIATAFATLCLCGVLLPLCLFFLPLLVHVGEPSTLAA